MTDAALFANVRCRWTQSFRTDQPQIWKETKRRMGKRPESPARHLFQRALLEYNLPMSKRDKIKRNRLKRYEDLASRRNYVEPMQYLFGQLKGAVDTGNHDKAIKIAMFLIPYGHAKALPKKLDGDDADNERLIVRFMLD